MPKIYTIPDDIEMIAGDTLLIPYDVRRDDGGYVDFTMSGCAINWLLSLWEHQDELMLHKSLENDNGISIDPTSPNTFIVTLLPEDTANLGGVFLYQIEMTVPSGETLRRVQGSITIAPIISSI